MTETPTTHYVKSDGVHIAYQVVGEGPFGLLFVPGFVSNMDDVQAILQEVHSERAALFGVSEGGPMSLLYRFRQGVMKSAVSFDHLVGHLLEIQRHVEAQRLGSLEIDDKLIFGGCLHRHVGWLFALENTIHVASGAPVEVDPIWPIGE